MILTIKGTQHDGKTWRGTVDAIYFDASDADPANHVWTGKARFIAADADPFFATVTGAAIGDLVVGAVADLQAS